MQCRPFATRKNNRARYLAVVLAGVTMLLLLSEAEAVRRPQMPVGIEEEEPEEQPKPKQVKIKVPEPNAESVWHAPAAAAPAGDTVIETTPRVAEDEAPAAQQPAPLPMVDTTNRLLQLTFEPEQLITGEQQRLDLDALAQRLKEEPMLRITLNSFASPREGQLNEARRISLKRAMDVRSYLIGKGVAKERINVRALGELTADEPKDRLDITPL